MLKLIAIIIMCLFLCGCGGKEEIDELALVMAVGIDKGDDNQIWVTAQIARPADVRGDKGAGGTGGEPIWTATGEGKTIFEAIRNLARFSSRRVYWGHNMLIVISEDVAREDGIIEIIDFFSRNNELRMRTWVVVTEKKANEIVSIKTGLEIIPGNSLDKLFRYSPVVAEAPASDMMSLSRSFLGENTHPYLAMVHIKDRGVDKENPNEFGTIPQIELYGTAIFRDDKMVGKLGPRESRGLLWFVEEVGNVIVPVKCPNEEGKASIELRDNKFDLKPFYENGQVRFEVSVKADTDLVELGCVTKRNLTDVMEELEDEVAAYLKQDFEAMLSKVQKEFKVDVLRLGRTFQGKYPQHWNKMQDDWEEMFPDIEIDITIDVILNNPQLLERPTIPSKD